MGKENTPGSKDLYGLVLVGGMSTRMGQDKAQIQWQGEKAIDRAFNLLSKFCLATYVSGRADQRQQYSQPFLTDTFEDIGPMGGITTALQSFAGRAWLVLAVDLFLIESAMLKYLIERRIKDAEVTLYRDTKNRLQPLCGIYEPGMQRFLVSAIEKKQFAMHMAILQSRYHPIHWPGDQNLFLNINTKRDLETLD